MQVTIFGASGKVGRLTVAEALRRGHTVVAFVHSQDLFAPSDKLIVRKGDVYVPQDVVHAIADSNAVISCLGSWGTPKRSVLSNAMLSVIPAMKVQGTRRIVTLTGIGVRQKPGPLYRSALRLITFTPAGKVFWDAEQHLELLSASDLDWTTVCSPVMNNSGGPEYRLSLHTGAPWATIARSSVARALVDQLDSTAYLQKTVVIHRK